MSRMGGRHLPQVSEKHPPKTLPAKQPNTRRLPLALCKQRGHGAAGLWGGLLHSLDSIWFRAGTWEGLGRTPIAARKGRRGHDRTVDTVLIPSQHPRGSLRPRGHSSLGLSTVS